MSIEAAYAYFKYNAWFLLPVIVTAQLGCDIIGKASSIRQMFSCK